MAKIARYTGDLKAFGSGALALERTVFGAATQSDTLDANLNSDFLRGWENGTDINGYPTKQFFNALGFTATQILAYLHQLGMAEWDSLQEYNTDSFTNRNGIFYVSLTDANIGNDPELDAVNWSPEVLADGSITTAKLDAPLTTKVGYIDQDVTAGASPSFNSIVFPATQVASGDPNTLDDYEEGTWTPTFTGQSGGAALSGSYTKIGNTCFITADLSSIGSTAGAGAVSIGGLPFSGSLGRFCLGYIYQVDWPAAAKQLTLRQTTGVTIGVEWSQDDAIVLAATGTDFDKVSSQIMLAGFYLI